jgi:hypothetical protein
MRQVGVLNTSAAILIGTLIQTSAVAGPEYVPAQGDGMANHSNNSQVAQPNTGDQYPRLNAPLYPSPVQYTPPWNGATIITNQALAPHEMLYPHEYRAMYPPFFYRVKGNWILTPLGVKQNETWKVQGTELRVNYRAHRGPFSRFFHAPR